MMRIKLISSRISFYAKRQRKIALALTVLFLLDLTASTTVWALTGGPSQPEVQSFEPVSTNQMVDVFSGDFTYNIPLLDVEGYPVNIAYHAGVKMEQEASWVGLGWNINPGVINRSIRGIPDDFNGDEIERELSIRPEKTLSLKANGEVELAGLKLKAGQSKWNGAATASAGYEFFYNNYRGFYVSPSFGTAMQLAPDANNKKLFKYLGANLSLQSSGQNGITLSAEPTLTFDGENLETRFGVGGTTYNSRNQRLNVSALSLRSLNPKVAKEKGGKKEKQLSNSDAQKFSTDLYTIPIGENTYVPMASPKMTNTSGSIRITNGGEVTASHPNASIQGTYAESKVLEVDKNREDPAYGYLFLHERKKKTYGTGAKAEEFYEGLADYNVDGNGDAFNPNMTYLSPANMTYDLMTVNAQGTGGMFRPFRNDIGIVSDRGTFSKGVSALSVGVELGVGAGARFGGDATVNDRIDKSGNWNDPDLDNYTFESNEIGDLRENVYYKSAGEIVPVNDAYQAMGGDKALHFGLAGYKDKDAMAITNGRLDNRVKYLSDISPRQARGKLVQTLNAEDAEVVGLDRTIISHPNDYPFNSTKTTFPRVVSDVREKHHISQVTQYEKDGSRYVFGLPAYNTLQEEVTFNVSGKKGLDGNGQPLVGGTVTYTHGTDDSKSNALGRDHYYSKRTLPAFAHSYLISGYLSPDYVDVTGDGITDDDLGKAVKFNWKRTEEKMGWRTPLGENKANFHVNNEADKKDDKATYTYGEKEQWYLQSIESRNYIAVFETADREDAQGVTAAGLKNSSQKSQKLKTIKLYAKEDIRLNNTSAKPIKTVRFHYAKEVGEYVAAKELFEHATQDIPNATAGRGKLTLKAIEFLHGTSSQRAFKPYEFDYNLGVAGVANVGYDPEQTDKWGNYKGTNVNGLNSAEYPYTNQEVSRATADEWAGLWNLKTIQLPSGGKIDVTYESDDYAYVQNRPAMYMVPIKGFGNGDSYNSANELYTKQGSPQNQNYFVYFELPESVKQQPTAAEKDAELKKYFNGIHDLYFKIRTSAGVNSADFNTVAGYAKLDGNSAFGRCTGSNSNTYGYVKLFPREIGRSGKRSVNPMVASAMQFFERNLNELVAPGGPASEPEPIDYTALAKKFLSFIPDLVDMFVGPAKRHLINGVGKHVDLNTSFIRLTKGDGVKLGGGHRVSEIRMSDDWSTVSGGESSSEYGQQYQYHNADGTSSGVASYEPLIGGEENPLRTPSPYVEKKNPGLSPNWELNQELPIGETFYPSATVGYARVQVRDIHNDKPSAKYYKEHQFYTARDFPVIQEATEINVQKAPKSKRRIQSPVGYSRAENSYTASQGYTVKLNDMHGKLKSEEHFNALDAANPVLVSAKRYNYLHKKVDISNAVPGIEEYYELVNKVKGITRDGAYADMVIGKEMDMTIETKKVYHKTNSNNVKGSFDNFLAPFVPSLVPWPMVLYKKTDNVMQMHKVVTTKIVQNYGILSSVSESDFNRTVTTENLVYDGHSGDVLVTQVKNEFERPLYTTNLPAYWVEDYDKMGHAYRNIDFVDRGGENITILGSCTNSSAAVEYMSHFIYEGLMDAYANHFMTQYNYGHPSFPTDAPFTKKHGDITGNLMTGGVFVPGDEILHQDGSTKEKLWVLNVLDPSVIQQMKTDGTICDPNTVTGLDDPNAVKCNQMVQADVKNAIAAKTGLDATKINTVITDLLNYSNTTASAKKICTWLDEFPLNGEHPGGFMAKNEMTAFADVIATGSGVQQQYNWNKMALLTKHILDDGDLKTIMNWFATPSTVSGALTPQNYTDIFEAIMEDQQLLDFMICKMEHPAILKLISLLGENNTQEFDFIRYVLRNEHKMFHLTANYNPVNNPNWPHVEAGPGPMYPLRAFFALTTMPTTEPWKFILNTPEPLATANFTKTHLDVKCKYDLDFSGGATTTQTRNPANFLASSCCLFDGETFDMTGKDLVIFIDRKGEIVSVKDNLVKIIRSGRRNMLNAKVGQIASFDRSPFGPFEQDSDMKNQTKREAYFDGNNTVLQASAVEYGEKWTTDRKIERFGAVDGNPGELVSINPYVYGTRGNFRPTQEYYSNKDRVAAGRGGANPLLADDGAYIDFEPFWVIAAKANQLVRHSDYATHWFKSSEYQQYSSINGNAVQVKNPIDIGTSIYSAELIGQHNKATAVANNAQRTEILSEGFEAYDRVDYVREHDAIYSSFNSTSFTNLVAHTGARSLRVNGSVSNNGNGNPVGYSCPGFTSDCENYPDPNIVNTAKYNTTDWGAINPAIPTSYSVKLKLSDLTNNFTGKYIFDRFNPGEGKYIISGWVKDGFNNDYISEDGAAKRTFTYNTTAKLEVSNGQVGATKINCFDGLDQAPFVDGWQRFEKEFEVKSADGELELHIDGGSFGAYFDDIRIYPSDAQMKTFVYDPFVLRLSAELDENNYATFYDYDYEGNLVRVRKETERGVMTIQESKKHTAQ